MKLLAPLRNCALLSALIGCCLSLPAQTTLTSTGNPNSAALFPVEHGFINLGNGDLHLEIPIAGIPQRGDLSLGAMLVYDSSIWEIVNGVGALTWSPTNGGGWSLQYGQNFFSTAAIAETACPNNSYITVYVYTDFQWKDPHGTVHVFPLKTVDLNDCSTSSQTDTPTAQGYSIDGSGFYGQVTNYTTLTIWDPAGTQVLQTAVPSAGDSAAKVIDRNGNYIQYGADGVVSSDSLAHTPIVETVGSTDSNGAPVVLFLDVPIVQSPSGQSQTARYTITYETIGVSTDFGVRLSGTAVQEASTTVRVIKSLGLPDGSSYQFQYDQTSGGSATAYGLLSGMTLPHLGTVSYGFQSDANSGSTEPARWASSYTGSNGNTTFAYAYQGTYTPTSETGGYSCGKIQNVATSAVLVSTYVFSSCGGAIQAMKAIQSPATSPQTVDSLTLYAYDFSNPCQNDACTGPQWIELTDSTVVLPSSGTTSGILSGAGGNGLIADTQTSYAAPGSGKISAVKQWDYYTANYQTYLPDSPPGNATRETDTTFGYTVNNALYPTDLTVKDATGTVGAEVQYSYDQSALVQAPSTTPNHSDSLAAATRGNLTSVHQIPHGGIGIAPTLQTVFSYDAAGTLISLEDPNTNASTLGYDSTDTFPQTVTRPATFGLSGPISHITSSVNDFNTGLPLSATDENQQTTTFNYDTAGRLHTVVFSNAASPVTLKTLTYPSVTETDTSILQSQNSNGTVLINSASFVDGYGRPSSVSQSGVSSETVYNTQGQIYSVTNPHLANTPSPTDGTSYFYYDELGRLNSVTMPTTYGSTIKYSLNTATITDPLQHQRQQTFDSFGDLSSVGEPDSTGAFNWITAYNYNGLGQLAEIDQKGGTTDSTQWRSRYFTYDGLGRLHTETTPEAGQYTYGYDNDGNVTSFQNQNTSNNSIHYFYDALNRIILKQVGGGPSYTYAYDAQDTSGDPYGLGRLTSISNGGNTRAKFTHDQFGQLVTQAERRPGNCDYTYRAGAGYDYQGNLVSLTYPDGRTVQNVFDTFNRPIESVYTAWNGTLASPPIPYYVGATYWPTGVLQGVTDGSGVQVSATYDPNQNIASLQYANNGANLLSAAYTFDKNGKNLTQIVDTASGRTQTFHYDWLDRIHSSDDTGTTSARTNPSLPTIPSSAMSFDIDQWGNLKQSGNYNFTQSIDANNQIMSSGYSYDFAGNLTMENLGGGVVNNYTYRADGHQTSSNSVTYAYDALDNRVNKAGSSTTQYFYFGGTLLATLDGSGNWNDMLYGVHGILGTVAGNPNAQPVYRVGDHLDTVAQTTDNNGSTLGGATLLPFGQTLSNTTGSNFDFTGLEQDTENFSVATAYRQYSPAQGRWLSPDPSAESYNFADPQSLNRYAYVLNRPIAASDPSGLAPGCSYAICLENPGSVYSSDYSWYGGGLGSGGGYDFLGGGGVSISSIGGPAAAEADSGFSSRESYRYNGPGSNASHDAAGSSFLDWTHTALAGLGLFPGLGEIANVANVGLDIARGDWKNLAVDGVVVTVGLVPGGADVVRGAELLGEGAEALEGVAEAGEATEAATALTHYYPANNGFLGGTSSEYLRPGQLIDRYGGSESSRFFSPPGTSAAARSLPAASANQSLRTFEVLKPFPVESGTVAPAFGQTGLGTQFRAPVPLGTLLGRGILREVP